MPFEKRYGRIVDGGAPVCGAIKQHHAAELGVANSSRILQDGIEHGLQIERRAEMTLRTSAVAVCC